MPYAKLSQKHIQNTKIILNIAPYKAKALQFLRQIQWLPIVAAMEA